MQETFNPSQREASLQADALLRAAGAPTYTDLRRLLDESMRTLSMISRTDKSVTQNLLDKLQLAVPNHDERARYAPRRTSQEAVR